MAGQYSLKPLVVALALCGVVLAGCGRSSQSSQGKGGLSSIFHFGPTPTPFPIAFVEPRGLRVVSGASATPQSIVSFPSLPYAGVFAPGAQAYVPGHGFTPDGKRVVDLIALQVSLDRYFAKTGRYPQTLAALFPRYAPRDGNSSLTAPPVDPVTHLPYAYSPNSGNTNFSLSAVLDSGRTLTLRRNGGQVG